MQCKHAYKTKTDKNKRRWLAWKVNKLTYTCTVYLSFIWHLLSLMGNVCIFVHFLNVICRGVLDLGTGTMFHSQ